MDFADAHRKFLFALGSARRGGNTELLARRAAELLPEDVEQRWLWLPEVPLPAFGDHRHTGSSVRHPVPEGNERALLEATLDATDIVIASPLYWYSVSASTKLFLDYWSGWLYLPGVDFKARMSAKTLWGISVLAEHDESQADPLVGMLERGAGYLGMRFGGVLLGNGSRPGQVLNDARALARAEGFFQLAPALARR